MKIIFFGSSGFAVPVLDTLKDREEVVLVVTQPDRKKGRSLKVTSTPVKKLAQNIGIEIFQPDTVNCKDAVEYLKKFNADLFIVVSFGQILRKEVLSIPKLYCLNVHGSLLPKYRGAAPINRAIADGEKETGVTIIKMNEKMDEGDIALKEAVSIDECEDAIMLSGRLSGKGAKLILDSMELIKKNAVNFIKQPNTGATYAPRLKKEDGLIDWKKTADEIYNRIRAFVPWPGCFTYWDKKLIKIYKVSPDKNFSLDSKPGTVLKIDKNGILVNTGDGALWILELQLEGKRRMNSEEFVIGHRAMKPGVNFCCI
ncbi:MAG: methionyl-tRNA formyltransferase [Candidatus Omnitrophica bacterium]|nr:methionyl-tRNA formyltransferase [Candidatus Omnitrophota bacterium]